MTQNDHILAHWGPPENLQIFHFCTPGTPQDPDRRDLPGHARGGEGTDIHIYVYLQLQGPGSRLGTPNGAFKIVPKAYH